MRINSSKPEQKYLVDQMKAIMADINASDLTNKLDDLMSGVEVIAAGVWRRSRLETRVGGRYRNRVRPLRTTVTSRAFTRASNEMSLPSFQMSTVSVSPGKVGEVKRSWWLRMASAS